MEYSVLFSNRKMYKNIKDTTVTEKTYFKDLGLDLILKPLIESKEEFDLEAFYYSPLKDIETIIYRQDILRDLEDLDVLSIVSKFSNEVYSIRNRMDKIRKDLIASFGGNFREVIVGGAAMSKDAESFFHKVGFPFTVGYGMTECAPFISYDSHRDFLPTSCGRVLEGIMEARIDSDEPSRVNSLTADGSVAVGWIEDDWVRYATYWDADNVQYLIDDELRQWENTMTEILRSSLRTGDVFTFWNELQVLILLQNVQEDGIQCFIFKSQNVQKY